MNEVLECWRCGRSIAEFPLPLGRTDECPGCRADLHVCRMCRLFDTSVAHACREPIADEVQNKERANFCGYFDPLPNAFRQTADSVTEQAQTKLAALFGDSPSPAASANGQTPADRARSELDALFRKD